MLEITFSAAYLFGSFSSYPNLTSVAPADFGAKQTGVSSVTMTRTIALMGRKGKGGNPNWGHPPPPLRALPTEFEMLVKRLGLAKPEYVSSAELKRWCEHNRNRVYIPE